MKEINLGIIGHGHRGAGMLGTILECFGDIKVTYVCDEYEDRTIDAAKNVREICGKAPASTTNPYELIKSDKVNCVMIFAAWEAHIPLAVEAMKAGKTVALEVGGAYSVDDCWNLVRTYEETKTPFMMLENCCYGKYELMLLEVMKKKGFGKVSHCTGAYGHDLRSEITGGIKNRHYRLRNYITRNCDNYPTHALGPIAKLLKINKGNRMISLVSVASVANGLADYIKRNLEDDANLKDLNFIQGDVVTTIIKCAGGETITLNLDTTLPRFYSRGLTIRGTYGGFCEDNRSIYFDNGMINEENEFDWKAQWGNAEEYLQENLPEIWKKYGADAESTGHEGMDYMVLKAFFESVKNDMEMPIDVYDAAAWMAVTALSECSVANGGAPVAIPDFTCGKWLKDKDKRCQGEFSLDF